MSSSFLLLILVFISTNSFVHADDDQLLSNFFESSGEISGSGAFEGSADFLFDGSSEGSAEGSTEGSTEESGNELIESSGEGSGENGIVPIDAVTLKQLGVLNTYAHEVQVESQKVVQQANLVMTQMSTLSMNAQNLGVLSTILSTNSENVFKNAENVLNATHPEQLICTPAAVCYNDNGCGGGKCIGALAGTCDCNGCIYGWPCQDDNGCGGFNGACNTKTSTCDCYAAYTHNNLTLVTALTSFCNVAKCDANNHKTNCFGLSCNYGFCVC